MTTLQMESAQTVATAPMLEQTRVLRAPRAKVYEAWTNPEVIKRWFAPGNMSVPDATLDVREGGSFRIEMRGALEACMSPVANEDLSYHTAASGAYTKIVPNQFLQFTWTGDWDPSETSLVTVSFKDVPGGTEITLKHERFATEGSRDRHQHGWNGSLTKLAQAIETA